jgi:hypothetical protein
LVPNGAILSAPPVVPIIDIPADLVADVTITLLNQALELITAPFDRIKIKPRGSMRALRIASAGLEFGTMG